MVSLDTKGTIRQALSFLLVILRSGFLAEIRWSVCISKSHRSLCVSFSRTDAGFCIYHLFVGLNFNFLHYSLWITLPTQPCLVLHFSVPTSFIRLLCDWLFRLYHHITYICYFVASYLFLIWLVLMALFCAAIRRDSVSLLRLPFLSYIYVFSCEMLLISCFIRP